jgi:methylenetetrahydrofolate/methylenetetrahydromethanopterin dehydrogenase (NADP+)
MSEPKIAKPKILVQLDSDPQPSVFDGVVAVDAGVDQLFRHAGVAPDRVRDLVYGAMFTRGVDDLRNTAIFVGGSNVAAGEAIFAAVRQTFFGPMRVSVMLDSNGANTTAAAAVLAAGKHLPLSGAQVLVLAATGPVGSRVVRLLAAQGAFVRAASRDQVRAERICREVAERVPGAKVQALGVHSDESLRQALDGAAAVITAGAPGVELLPAEARRAAKSLKVAIDLSAVPPLGIGGIEVTDKAKKRDDVLCYGALGVGGLKMKIHKAAIGQLFSANDQVLDAEEIYQIGQKLAG